jgi:methanol--5-hydroxybenzimidazolylcobamide Co-methyltransferase
MKYSKLAINTPEELLFGNAVYPVTTRRGLVIGGGSVIPELNFTLPPMSINKDTFPEICNHYRSIITDACVHARHLYSNGVIFEFETLLEMTQTPAWGVELVKIMNDICEDNYQKYGFKSEIRLTPNDLREFDRPPLCRTSKYLDAMWELFDKGAQAGGDMLSIESTGGKEVHDEALMMCDIKQVVFALSVLGVRDMKMLWSKIVAIAGKNNCHAGGDTACGFGNTAMVLAEKGFIPKIFAAVVRVVSAVRTLVAIEEGAVGPDKDCGYEGPFLKAITGTPISMEGKASACAHFSPLGNIAACCCDLWSNESIQNIKLLSGMAPTVSLEHLEYDTRLMNQALKVGRPQAKILQKLLSDSDCLLDPQALILSPENVIAISKEIVSGENYIDAAVRAAQKALDIIEEAILSGQLKVSEIETTWPEILRQSLSEIPTDESRFTEEMLPICGDKFILSEYDLV